MRAFATWELIVYGVGLWSVGVAGGWAFYSRRWRSRVRSMWMELGLRTKDHGPLEMREVADVVDRWTGKVTDAPPPRRVPPRSKGRHVRST